jgi:hypothetical protein
MKKVISGFTNLHMGLTVIVVLTPNEHFVSYVMVGTSYIQQNDDDVSFVLDQQSDFVYVYIIQDRINQTYF